MLLYFFLFKLWFNLSYLLPGGCLDLSSSAFNPVINQEKAIYVAI